MSEPNDRERVLEILKQARRPEGEVTPETLEENLHWMIGVARPEVKASEALRQRVEAMVVARHRRRRHAPLFGAGPFARRMLLGAIPLAIVITSLFFLVTPPAPAEVLDRALNVMARLRSAHCTGRMIGYRTRNVDGQPLRTQMSVEWWYKAPDWFRKDQGPEPPGGAYTPGQLIVKGDKNVFISQYHAARGAKVVLPPQVLTSWLSPLDFFSREGFIHRAQFEKKGQITQRKGVYRDRPVHIVEVEVIETTSQEATRGRWTLTIDPATHLLLRSQSRVDSRKKGGAWQTMDEEILDNFEYNVAVKDSLFDVQFPPQSVPPA